MTTTLRPTGPIQQSDGRVRSRHYQVCVNSRPVGETELATDENFGPDVGRIRSLHIDETDRRRGRGTVAALAAEEVLRSWGCRRVEASVPAAEPGALALAAALGYVERNHQMSKPLAAGAAVALPQGSHGRPMTDEEYARWAAESKISYMHSWVDRGVPEAEAQTKAERDHARFLPGEQHTPGAALRVLEDSTGTGVGTLWLALTTFPGMAYVMEVKVDAAHRGRGHGRSLMLLAEAEARSAGHEVLGLNVFAGNAPALSLYDSLGYRPLTHYLYKTLL